jgi:Arm DNA-binding domain
MRLRVYATGAGRWLLQYRKGRQTNRYQIPGSAAAITLKQAKNLASIISGEIAKGVDLQEQRREALDKPKFTLGAMMKRFLDEGIGVKGDKLSPTTLYSHINVMNNHLGRLARMQVDEIEKRDVSDKIKEVAKNVGGPTASHLRS